MHAEHQCSTLVTWSNLKEWCRATHKPPKTMKRLTTYGDVKIWAWFCLVLLAVLLMTLERQHKSCMRGSPHFILGHYDKSVAHCKNELLWVMPFLYEMWPLLLLWLWYLTNNNPTLILQKFAGWSHHNSQLTYLPQCVTTFILAYTRVLTSPILITRSQKRKGYFLFSNWPI